MSMEPETCSQCGVRNGCDCPPLFHRRGADKMSELNPIPESALAEHRWKRRNSELKEELDAAQKRIADLEQCEAENHAALVTSQEVGIGRLGKRVVELEEELRLAAEWLESRPDYTEGDAATSSRCRAVLRWGKEPL